MAGERFQSEFRGIRYREHPTRKFQEPGKKSRLERYYFIRHAVNKKIIEEGVGWESAGWTIGRVLSKRDDLMKAKRTGQGPKSIKEEDDLAKAEVEARARAEAQEDNEHLTFSILAAQYVEWGKANKKSWRHDERRLRLHVLPIIGELILKEIGPAQCEAVKVDCQEKGLAVATINHCLQLIRVVFNHAILMGLFEGRNPTKKIKFFKPNNKRTRYLKREEAQRLIDALKKRSQDWADIAELAIYTGMRFGEIAALTWPDVDFEGKSINIRDAKSGEGREVFIIERIETMLRRRKEKARYQLVFPGRMGQKMDKVSRTFDRVVNDLGFNDGIEDRRQRMTFHTTRHTFGSWLAIQGTPLQVIMKRMGHKSYAMTLRYAHLMRDQERQAVEMLDQGATAKVIPLRTKTTA